MVDEKLAEEVKALREGGFGDDPKVLLKLQELMKQASAELDDLKEELEDIDQFVGQMVIADKGFKMWLGIDVGHGKSVGKKRPKWVMLYQKAAIYF